LLLQTFSPAAAIASMITINLLKAQRSQRSALALQSAEIS